MAKVVIMDHPLIQHKIGLIRRKETGTKDFYELVQELAMLICFEATRNLELRDVEIETPLCKTVVKELSGKKLTIAPIMRAGLEMANGMRQLIPAAKIAHIGLFRDETTLKPQKYFCKTPPNPEEREAFVVDPMLATGGSAVAAVQEMKDRGFSRIHFLCLCAAPEGVKVMQESHPDVDLYIGALDDHLNEHGYIVPGLGDAGDRLYGTK